MDIERGFTWSEEYRHQKEVEFVASHDGQWITDYLEGINKKRGVDACVRLRNDVRKLWKDKIRERKAQREVTNFKLL